MKTRKKHFNKETVKYLIVECTILNDQFECDADRTPVCITENPYYYDKYGYEIFKIKKDGTFEMLRYFEYEDNYLKYY